MPSEDLNSTPIELFNAGSKIYCFGTKQIIVINSSTGDVISTIPLTNSGSYYAQNFLNICPKNRLITGNVNTNRLYCADLLNNFYVIDMVTDQILLTHSIPAYSDQLSTSVAYDETGDMVYWLVNSWEGSAGTQINAYNGTTGAYVSQRFFDEEIIDIMSEAGYLFITYSNNVSKLDPQTLATTQIHTIGIFHQFTKMFRLNDNEFAVEKRMQYLDNYLEIFDMNLTEPIQTLPFALISSYNDITVTTQNERFILLCRHSNGDSRLFFMIKDNNNEYIIEDNLPMLNYYLITLSEISETGYVYVGGGDYLGGINAHYNTIDYSDEIDGCCSYNLTTVSDAENIWVFSANPKEGTISRHNNICTLDNITQTAFKTNTACYNPVEEKMYFVNSRINFERSRLAIIDCSTDEVITTIGLGKYLTEAVYNELSNDVFVAGKKSNEVYVVDGVNDELTHTISLPGSPTHLFSYQNYIFCGTVTAIYIIDIDDNYSYTTILLTFNESSERCKEFEMNEDNNRLYALYDAANSTFNVEIDLNTNNLHQTHEFDMLKGADIEYDNINDLVYIVNSFIPQFYVYDPDDFSLLTTVDYHTPTIFYDLEMEIDYLRNKVYLTYEVLQGDRSVSIIDCDDYSFETMDINAAKSSQAFNPINEQVYHYNIATNEDNRNEIFYGVLDCLDDENMDDVYSGNLLNRNYSIHSNFDKIKPLVNAGQNKIYWPNGDFSNISVIDCHTDKLDLYAGWTWLSFPRIERTDNDAFETIPVLQRIECFPVGLRLNGLINNIPIYKEYDPIEFPHWTGSLNYVVSTSGYKLYIDYQGGMTSEIDLYGAKLDPETEMTLEPIFENWIGYFLEQSQDPWDALGGQEWVDENLQMIKTQFWTTIKECNQGDEECVWRTDGRITPFEYGDMIILVTDKENAITLQWASPVQPPSSMSIPQPEYFSYEEKSDYIPMYMEFDSSSDIQEIAVIADGEYKGAAVRLEGDTIVELNAYLEGTPTGTPLEFETWNGFKASNIKDNYLVFDNQLQTNVKRQIYAGENRQYYVISLREGEEFNIPENISEAYCRPNPFTGETTITFRLNKSQNTKVEIFNLSGKSIKTMMEGEFPAGLYNLEWKGNNTEGNKVKEGVYFYRINCGDKEVISGKIVKIK